MKDLARLLVLLVPYRRWMITGVMLSVLVMLANIGLLALAGWFITAMATAGLAHASMDYFTPSAGIRGLAIVRTLGRYLERLVTHDATLRLLAQLRVWFYEHLEPLAPARLQYFRGGDLLSRIRGDIDTLDNFYLQVVVPVLAAIISVSLFFSFISIFSLPVALINIGGLAIVGVIAPILARRWGSKPGKVAVEVRANLRASVIDSIQGQAELQVFGAAQQQKSRLLRLTEELITPQRQLSRISGFSTGLSDLATQFSIWLSLLIAIPEVSHHNLSGPDLAMLVMAVMASFETVNGLPLAFQNLGETLAAARRIFEVIDAQPQVKDPVQPMQKPTKPDLSFAGVRMRYTDDAPWALNGFDLELCAGQRIAIVGASGSGKTTLVNLLLRFWDYQEGIITLSGRDLRAYAMHDIRGFCSVVSQNTHLFNTTIRANLMLARPDASENQLIDAAKRAHIHEAILAMPDGYDTFVGEAGIRLSGGQARRIAIARALLKDAPLLILDEPTEGLDAHTEEHVLTAIETAMEGRSVLFITHRPAALKRMDRIYLMEYGRILAHGTPEALSGPDGSLGQFIRIGCI